EQAGASRQQAQLGNRVGPRGRPGRLLRGVPHAAEQLLPLVYDELRKLAAAKLAQEKPGQTLQATALVHEAYLRLVDVKQAERWTSGGPFFAAEPRPPRGRRSVGKAH